MEIQYDPGNASSPGAGENLSLEDFNSAANTAREEQRSVEETQSETNSAAIPDRWVDDHGDCLYRYALLRVRTPEVAQDLVQESLSCRGAQLGQMQRSLVR